MTDSKNDNIIQFPSQEELRERMKGVQVIEWVFTNDKENPYPQQILHAFYDGVFKNRVGVMHAKVRGSEDIHTLLVGVEVHDDGNVACYPLAKILAADEHDQYVAPDGNGGWLDGSE